MKNCGTEFIASEEIKLTDNQYNASVLTPEANVYVDDEWTTYNKKLETDKKRKKPEENSPITWKRNVSPHSQESYLLEDRDFYQLDEGAPAFHQNGRKFFTNAKEMKASLGVSYIMAVKQLPSIPLHWDCNHFYYCNHFNIFTRTRYQKVLQNLHFAYKIFTLPTTENNTKQIKAIRLDQLSTT